MAPGPVQAPAGGEERKGRAGEVEGGWVRLLSVCERWIGSALLSSVLGPQWPSSVPFGAWGCLNRGVGSRQWPTLPAVL